MAIRLRVRGCCAERTAQWISIEVADLHKEGDIWIATGAEGPIRITFRPHNDHGVMDHWVDAGSGDPVHIPLRVVQNGDGAEVMLTLYRQPGMDDEKFSADAKWIMKDLTALKTLVETLR